MTPSPVRALPGTAELNILLKDRRRHGVTRCYSDNMRPGRATQVGAVKSRVPPVLLTPCRGYHNKPQVTGDQTAFSFALRVCVCVCVKGDFLRTLAKGDQRKPSFVDMSQLLTHSRTGIHHANNGLISFWTRSGSAIHSKQILGLPSRFCRGSARK